MLNKLNGWQRIGVVITGVWVIFVLLSGAVGLINLERGQGPFVETVKGTPARCTTPAPPAKPEQKSFTFEEAHGCAPGALVEGTQGHSRFMWGALAIAAVAPAILAWLLAYAVVAIVRWVAKGFRGKAT
jgi:hypothetical protein